MPLLRNPLRRRLVSGWAFRGAVALLLCRLIFAQGPGVAGSAEILQALHHGNNRLALQWCERDLAAHPNDAQVWLLRGIALSGLGRMADSLAAFRHALKLRPGWPPALEGAAQAAYQSGDPSAKSLLVQLIRKQPGNETAHAMLGALAFLQGDCADAIAQYRQGESALQQDPHSLAELGDCLVRLGKPDEARLVFQRWLGVVPSSIAARYDLGLADHLTHRDREAVVTLRPLLDSTPNRVDALNLIAAAEESEHHTAAAVAHLRQAIVLAPHDPRNYLDLASISLAHHSYAVGVDVVNAGLKVIPENAALYIARGVLQAQLAHYAEAEADFRHADQLQPRHAAATVGLGIAMMQTDRTGAAIQMLQRRLKAQPDDPVLNYLYAEALDRSGMTPESETFAKALTALHRALAARPEFVEARDELSALELRAHHPRQAAADARLALRQNPSRPSALYHLLLAARQLGDTHEAAVLAARLARVQAAAQGREAAASRVRLVEMPAAGSTP